MSWWMLECSCSPGRASWLWKSFKRTNGCFLRCNDTACKLLRNPNSVEWRRAKGYAWALACSLTACPRRSSFSLMRKGGSSNVGPKFSGNYPFDAQLVSGLRKVMTGRHSSGERGTENVTRTSSSTSRAQRRRQRCLACGVYDMFTDAWGDG